jgi:hypothetical protein
MLGDKFFYTLQKNQTIKNLTNYARNLINVAITRGIKQELLCAANESICELHGLGKLKNIRMVNNLQEA